MSDPISDQARADFQKARFQAFLNRVWGTISGQRSTLLSYDEIKEKLHVGGPIYRGVKTIRVDQIAGSLNRYHEFDQVFLPASDKLAARWTSVNRAFYQDISLPQLSYIRLVKSISWWMDITACRWRASRDRFSSKRKCASVRRASTSRQT